MADPVSSIRNLGPAADRLYARAGMPDADSLRALGADAAYLKLLQSGARPHFIGYYALVMGLAGRPWNECRGAEKAALRQRFERLKAEAAAAGNTEAKTARAELEKHHEQIGIRAANRSGK